MTEMMGQGIIDYLTSAAWNYLAANWGSIALYLIVAGVVCAIVRKLLALYGTLPLIVGVVMLIIGAWTVGYRSAPVKTAVRTVVRTVEKPVTDNTELDRLRKRIAALTAEKDSAIAQGDAARRKAEAALAQLRQELAAAIHEIQRLLGELSTKPQVATSADDANGQCPKCNHLMRVGPGLRNEQVRCYHCGLIMSAKTAWARRAYVLDRQRPGDRYRSR